MPLPINIFFLVFIGFASALLLRTLWIASSSERIDSYLKETKKGKKWIDHYGYEKSLKMMKTVAIPIGIIAPLFFIGAGIAMYNFISGIIASGQI